MTIQALGRTAFALALAGLLTLTGPARAVEPAIQAELPLLVTSAGQALDAFTVKTLLGRAKLEHDYDPLAEADKLDGYRTVIVAFGASIKGFGAAGITAETELARTRALIEAAREHGITLIGVHIGGSERRDALSMQFAELVAPAVDLLVVWADGNQDGWFTQVAEREGIPLVLLDQPIAVGTALADLFES